MKVPSSRNLTERELETIRQRVDEIGMRAPGYGPPLSRKYRAAAKEKLPKPIPFDQAKAAVLAAALALLECYDFDPVPHGPGAYKDLIDATRVYQDALRKKGRLR